MTMEPTRLGRVQVQVLASLTDPDMTVYSTVRQLADDWPGLTEGSVRGALDRLWRRSLVERDGANLPAFVWHLTAAGKDVAATLFEDRGAA